MKDRSLRIVLALTASSLLAIVLLFTFDARLAINHMNPLPEAEAAAADAGFGVEWLTLQSFEVEGGMVGGSAVVKYLVSETTPNRLVEVHLRRALLSSHWDAVGVDLQE